MPGQIFAGGRYLIFDFSMSPDIRIPLEALGGSLAYVGYIKEPRWILWPMSHGGSSPQILPQI